MDLIRCVACAPNGRWVATGSFDRTLRLWEIGGGQSSQIWTSKDRIFSLAFSTDSQRIVVGGESSVAVLETETMRVVQQFSCSGQQVIGVAFADEHRVLTASMDDRVRTWEVQTGKVVDEVKTGRIVYVAFHPTTRHLIFSSAGNKLHHWNLATRQETQILEAQGPWERQRCVAISPDGKWALSGGDDRLVRLWDLSSGKELVQFEGHTRSVQCVAFSPDGKLAASGGDDQSVHLWSLPDRQLWAVFRAHTGAVRCIAFSADGQHLVSGSEDKQCLLWEITLPHADDASNSGESPLESHSKR